jgi:acetolactate synthase-1/2/3 large subunit
MQRSFNQMMTGRKGPVVVSMPMDVQAASIETALPEPVMHKAGVGPAATPETIDAAVEVMRGAKRPVILAGGAMLRSGCHDKLVALAELWGAAVVTTMAGKSAFPEDHPLYGFHTGSKGTPVGIELTRNADVVLALGPRFADETTCSYRKGAAFNFPDTKLIHVDIEAGEIGKTYGCDVGVLGDLSVVTGQLLEAYRADVKADNDYMRSDYT